MIKGTNHAKVQEFYEKLRKSFRCCGEDELLGGFAMTTQNKLPNVKPDLKLVLVSSARGNTKRVFGEGRKVQTGYSP